jgi:hypothetical protein
MTDYFLIHERGATLCPLEDLVKAIKVIDLLNVTGSSEYNDLIETLDHKIGVYLMENKSEQV